MKLYDEKLASLGIEYKDVYLETKAGKTHVLVTGNMEKQPIAVFHGINAGAPITLEALKGLLKDYCIYAIDTIGQLTKSSEKRLPMKDNSHGRWLEEVLGQLNLHQVPIIGVSFGAFLLQKLIIVAPEKVERAIFVVPGGLVNGRIWESIKKLAFSLIRGI